MRGGAGARRGSALSLSPLPARPAPARRSVYNKVVNRCFMDCVNSFRHKSLDGKEDECVSNCTRKFLAFTQRAAVRFAEAQHEFGSGQ